MFVDDVTCRLCRIEFIIETSACTSLHCFTSIPSLVGEEGKAIKSKGSNAIALSPHVQSVHA